MKKWMPIWLLLMPVSFLAPIAEPVWATEEIEHKKVIVASTNDEVDDEIKVQKGDLIVILAGGNITVGGWVGEVDAEGSSAGDGALIAKIGVGAGFYVGAKNVIVCDAEGTLKVKVKDGNYADNSGQFEVSILRIPVDAVPAAEIVEAK